MPLRRSLGCLEETEGHDDEDAREKSTDVPRRVRGRSRYDDPFWRIMRMLKSEWMEIEYNKFPLVFFLEFIKYEGFLSVLKVQTNREIFNIEIFNCM